MKILYMNSFSRSGETLMLRTLNAHVDLAALHQLLGLRDESEYLYDVFKRVRRGPAEIELSPEEKTAIGVGDKKILLVKNAVFEIARPHYGFILVRNPFSVYASYKILAATLDNPRSQMKRWAKNIDSQLEDLVVFGDFIDAFCALYTRKMGALLQSGLPVVRYEDFVADPERALKGLMKSVQLEWDPGVLSAHQGYPAGKKGHGGIDLSAPICADKAYDLPILSKLEIDKIYAYTSFVSTGYGYEFDFAKRRVILR